ncbi:hypothetical protein VH441_07260 [Psychrobacter sp. HD31]
MDWNAVDILFNRAGVCTTPNVFNDFRIALDAYMATVNEFIDQATK